MNTTTNPTESTALELVITTDMDRLPAAIEFNYTELRSGLEAYLSKFDGLIVGEDGIRAAETDRADINRIAKAISRARIDTKKRYLAPFEVFETKAKELEAMCKTAEGKISEQLDTFEARRREEKLAALRGLFAGKLSAAFPPSPENALARKSPHWKDWFAVQTDARTKGNLLLKTVSGAAAGEAMDKEIERCLSVLRSVRTAYGERDAEIRARAEMVACQRFDFQQAAEAVAEAERVREAAREAEARAAQGAAARAEAAAAAHAARMKAAMEAGEGADTPARAPAPEAAPAAPEEAPAAPAPETTAAPAKPAAGEIHSAHMLLTGTIEQFKQLRAAIERIGMAWSWIKD